MLNTDMRRQVIIMGAAGRDFHNFNVYFRNNPEYEVVAFTATQIPSIEGRKYPKELAGELYPEGILIYPETELEHLIQKHKVELVVFAYSDVSHEYVMHKGSVVLSCGADYMLLGPASTMLKSNKPVIGIGAVRTGCGKSPTTRKIAKILSKLPLGGKKVVVVRHPMPYGNRELIYQEVQRFETCADLKKCTIEEHEEFEPYIRLGIVVYAGVDYEKILHHVESEGDIILWDGGNNDFPFYKPDLFIVVIDPLRAGDEVLYHPGETCLRMADIVVINKVDSAKLDDIRSVRENVYMINPGTQIIEANSTISLEDLTTGEKIEGKSVLVVEDGPTLTHGGMEYGAGYITAKRYGASEIIEPKPYAVGSMSEVYEKYPWTGKVLPAIGYEEEQIRDLEQTIDNVPSDVVIIATPVDLRNIIKINKPCIRVTYELEEISEPTLEEILIKWANERL